MNSQGDFPIKVQSPPTPQDNALVQRIVLVLLNEKVEGTHDLVRL
jgi:hypothetical protein